MLWAKSVILAVRFLRKSFKTLEFLKSGWNKTDFKDFRISVKPLKFSK